MLWGVCFSYVLLQQVAVAASRSCGMLQSRQVAVAARWATMTVWVWIAAQTAPVRFVKGLD
jgi:hypothetical protein